MVYIFRQIEKNVKLARNLLNEENAYLDSLA